MDRNFLLAIALSFAVLTAWTMYQEATKPPVDLEELETPDSARGEGLADRGAPSIGDAPTDPERSAEARTERATGAETRAAGAELEERPEERVRVRTALYEAELSTRGGGLTRFELTDFDDPSQQGRPRVDIVTLGDEPIALATPFGSLGFGDLSRASYRVDQPDPLTVIFSLQASDITIRKTYLFDPDSYLFRLRLEVDNGSARYVAPTFRVTWPATLRESADFAEFIAAAFSEGSLEQEIIVTDRSFMGMGGGGFEEERLLPRNVDWAGALTRYFMAAILPEVPRDTRARFDPVVPGEFVNIEVEQRKTELPPGQRLDREYQVYLGPKIPERLDAVGANLDEAILKGWFPSLTRFFTWLLMVTYGFVPNYGVAIILITVFVRVLMAPLMARQMKSMKRMSVLQPKVKEIQEKYPDDRQKQSEAMMSVYREAGVNPLSMMTGCLPMFLQLPVFIGFYYALQGAIQLRQQPFVGWIDDLSVPETLFVIPGLELPVRLLPLLMGGSMVLQQKLTPTTMDPAQARMMLTIMPVMFTFLFYQFASGLVLYWLVSTLLGIGQQLLTNRSKD